MNRSHGFRMLGLALVAALTIVGLSHCRFVDDSITGVDLKNSVGLKARSDCRRTCKEAFKEAKKEEKARYKDAKDACGNDKDCRDAAKAEHERIMDELEQREKDCKDGCYNEGGGLGG